MIKEIIVVEGHHDVIAIKRAVDADTIITGGSAISKKTLDKIHLAQQRRGVIILTDPDYAGERIRKIISKAIPGVKHAFIDREEGELNGDIGVENASPETIRKALKKVRTVYEQPSSEITWSDLIDLGLVGGAYSSTLRERCGSILGIGYGNAKQFFQRISIFHISKKEFIEAYEQAIRGYEHG